MHPIKQHLNYNFEVGKKICTVYFLISERFVVWIFRIFLDFDFLRLCVRKTKCLRFYKRNLYNYNSILCIYNYPQTEYSLLE